MPIRFVQHKEIDTKKWDYCIDMATNGMPYAYSWYLDITCNNQWAALVLNDYECIMPLPFNRKFILFPQIYNPLFSQQLGVFGKDINNKIILEFIQNIPKRFKRIHLKFNEENYNVLEHKSILKPRLNMYIDLNNDYDFLFNNYSKSLKKRIKKAIDYNSVQIENNVEEHLRFYLDNLVDKIKFNKENSLLIKKLIHKIIEKKKGNIYTTYNQNQEKTSSNLFLHSNNRIINLMGATNLLGKDIFSHHFILDYIIKENANKNLILDFEGSEIKGVQKFFQSFGAQIVYYGKLEQ